MGVETTVEQVAALVRAGGFNAATQYEPDGTSYRLTVARGTRSLAHTFAAGTSDDAVISTCSGMLIALQKAELEDIFPPAPVVAVPAPVAGGVRTSGATVVTP